MNLPDSDDFVRLNQQIKQTKLLVDSTTVSNILSPDTLFATIAYCFKVERPLKEKIEVSPNRRLSSSSWEGVDENNIQVGYLSHNKSNLLFQTRDEIIFNLPFSKLKIEAHGLGVLVKTHGASYIVGNFMAINEQLSPDNKIKYSFGGESTIWMRELANIGAIDKKVFEKSRAKSKQFIYFWFLIVIALTILVITL